MALSNVLLALTVATALPVAALAQAPVLAPATTGHCCAADDGTAAAAAVLLPPMAAGPTDACCKPEGPATAPPGHCHHRMSSVAPVTPHGGTAAMTECAHAVEASHSMVDGGCCGDAADRCAMGCCEMADAPRR